MPSFKCTIFFSQGKYGWSESYTQLRNDSSYVFAMARLQNLCAFRATILGSQAEIVGQRVSQFNITGDGFAKDQLYTGSLQADSNDPFTAVLATFTNATFSSRKVVYWRGVPDDVSQRGGVYVPGAVPGFSANIAQLISYLLTSQSDYSWGWWGRPTPKPVAVPLSGYTIDVGTGAVNVSFNGNIFTNAVIGTKQNVFFSGVNAPAKSALKGTQVVTVLTQDTCRITRPLALFPYVGGGQATWAVPVFQQFSAGDDERVTERKAGRNFFVERGRLPVRGRG